jgi:hypothetical protein
MVMGLGGVFALVTLLKTFLFGVKLRQP